MTRRLRIITRLATGVVLISGALLFNTWANQSNTTNVSTTNSSEVLGEQVALKPFASNYFSTTIPSTMKNISTSESSQPLRGSYFFGSTNPSINDQLAITVGSLENDQLSAVSAVKLRMSDTSNYKQIDSPSKQKDTIAFQKNDGYEKSVFWVDNGTYNAVVVSGLTLRQSALDQMLSTTLANWQSTNQ